MRQVFETNYFGPVALSNAVLPAMRRQPAPDGDRTRRSRRVLRPADRAAGVILTAPTIGTIPGLSLLCRPRPGSP